MATQDSMELWDKELEDIQRVDQSPNAKNTRRGLAGGETGMDLPQHAYNVITGIYTGPFIELWAAHPPKDPTLAEALQPVHDAAYTFTPYEALEPQIDRYLAVVSAAREALGDGGDSEPTAEQIIADMEMWLKVNLLVAGTSHLGPLKVIEDEIAKQAEAVRTGFRLPPRHFDFATNEVVNAPTKTSLPLAVFAASVDNAIASSWAEALQPDPADQPGIMKQFAAQLIVTFYTEWEEYYRPALAKALGCEPETLRLDYFGDIRNMRQDYVHMRGFCRNSVKNKILKWFTKRQAMIPTPENLPRTADHIPFGGTKGEAAGIHKGSTPGGG
jgi:hypothetical protein